MDFEVSHTRANRASSWASNSAVRAVMRANRKRDTGPELRIRRRLFSKGYRFFVSRRPLGPGSPVADIVFPRARLAIFVDGCYWHGCPEHFRVPKVHADYWGPKIRGNRRRDSATDEWLATRGWSSIHVWEHEPVENAVDRIAQFVERVRVEAGYRSESQAPDGGK
jgi:DNA mismatch endonuclease (patch repair protein)